jgi:hypothetical protein
VQSSSLGNYFYPFFLLDCKIYLNLVFFLNCTL